MYGYLLWPACIDTDIADIYAGIYIFIIIIIYYIILSVRDRYGILLLPLTWNEVVMLTNQHADFSLPNK